MTGLSVARDGCCVCVFDGRSYAFGGRFRNTAECYDSSSNTWLNIVPMQNSRTAASAAVIGGKVYVMGGYDASHNNLSSVECYDPMSNTWAYVESLSDAKSSFGVIVV